MAERVVVGQPSGVGFTLPSNLRSKGEVVPGLEYLAQIDQLIIKQQVELLEVLVGFETNNKYAVYNTMGQQVYYAHEETPCCMRNCCGPYRGFTMHISDANNKEVMRVTREFKCCGGCSPCAAADCAAHEVVIEAPPGNIIGYGRQMAYCCKPVLAIFDAHHDQVATLRGPLCVCNCPCCGDVEFPVLTVENKQENEQRIAMCSKQWTGAILEMFTDADTFNVRFPMEMDVKTKATLFGTMFLIDMMFFEDNSDDN